MIAALKLVLSFINALPELVKLVQAIQKSIDENEIKKKVKEDVKQIKEAFNEKNPDKLNSIFKSK